MDEQPNGLWQNRIVGHGVKPADQFLHHPQNWRRHPDRQRKALRASLDAIGWIDSVIENVTTGHLLDGHERVWQALETNADVPYIQVELTEDEEKLALATLDAITGMAQAEKPVWDALVADLPDFGADVTAMLADIDGDLAAIVAGLDDGYKEKQLGGNPGAALERAEEWREQYGVERGQLWFVGKHRLLCGDAFCEDDLSRLLDGKQPDMAHLDPPYGIGIVDPRNASSAADSGGTKPFGSTNRRKRVTEASMLYGATHRASKTALMIEPNLYPSIHGDDADFDPMPLLDLAPVIILWGANYYADKLPPSPGWIVWDKRENITRNSFADCELAWTNRDKPARVFHHLWNGLHKGSQHGERRLHPTEKPVALFEEIGKMWCPGGLWLDLFAGSGPQLVAAERVGATCYAMEIEPLYVATILQRCEAMGLTVHKADEKSPALTGEAVGVGR